MMRAHSRLAPRRAGFTLVELLVVIAIIAVLVGLSGAAYFRWIDSARADSTEKTMSTVLKSLQAQMKAVADRAGKETIPASVLGQANNDPRLAKVIWVKLRLKQEFPTTYAEARQPWATGMTAADLPAKQVYVRALSGKTPTAATESATLLLLALQQNRGAGVLNPDDLGPGAADTDNDGLKEVVDGWGTPLVFRRWPAGDTALDAANPFPTTVKAGRFADPYDPDGLLLMPAWYGTAPPAPTTMRTWFETNFHTISPDGKRAYYFVPTLVSGGRDNKVGTTADNIASYQLKLGGARKE